MVTCGDRGLPIWVYEWPKSHLRVAPTVRAPPSAD